MRAVQNRLQTGARVGAVNLHTFTAVYTANLNVVISYLSLNTWSQINKLTANGIGRNRVYLFIHCITLLSNYR